MLCTAGAEASFSPWWRQCLFWAFQGLSFQADTHQTTVSKLKISKAIARLTPAGYGVVRSAESQRSRKFCFPRIAARTARTACGSSRCCYKPSLSAGWLSSHAVGRDCSLRATLRSLGAFNLPLTAPRRHRLCHPKILAKTRTCLNQGVVSIFCTSWDTLSRQ